MDIKFARHTGTYLQCDVDLKKKKRDQCNFGLYT